MAKATHSGAALADGLVLDIHDLSIQFGGLKAVEALSFHVKEQEIFGLIGPNGAGKTTAFNCITQFYHPDRGQVVFRARDGRVLDLVGLPVHDIIRLGLVRTFQNVEVIKELTLIDNVLIGAHTDFKATILEQALRLPRARREEREMRAKAVRALEFMGIAHLKDAPAGGQPYGVLKKVEMARTLMAQPKLIILDEPAAGLNDSETAELAETIRRMRRCLEEFTLEGFPTNAELSYEILFHPVFVRGRCTTGFLDEHLTELLDFSRRVEERET